MAAELRGIFWILALATLVALARWTAPHPLESTPEAPTSQTVTLQETEARVAAGEAVLIDARDEKAYLAGHIPGSINLPVDEFENTIDLLLGYADELQPLILYCNGPHCDMAERLGQLIQTLGYEGFTIYAGGWEEYSKVRQKAPLPKTSSTGLSWEAGIWLALLSLLGGIWLVGRLKPGLGVQPRAKALVGRRLVSYFWGGLVAVVFLYAAWGKLWDPGAFTELTGKYELLPEILLKPFGYALPALEAVVGLCLLAGLWWRPALLVSALLYGMFIGAISWALWWELRIDCGCFSGRTSEVGMALLLRDLFFLVVCLFFYRWGSPPSPSSS